MCIHDSNGTVEEDSSSCRLPWNISKYFFMDLPQILCVEFLQDIKFLVMCSAAQKRGALFNIGEHR